MVLFLNLTPRTFAIICKRNENQYRLSVIKTMEAKMKQQLAKRLAKKESNVDIDDNIDKINNTEMGMNSRSRSRADTIESHSHQETV